VAKNSVIIWVRVSKVEPRGCGSLGQSSVVRGVGDPSYWRSGTHQHDVEPVSQLEKICPLHKPAGNSAGPATASSPSFPFGGSCLVSSCLAAASAGPGGGVGLEYSASRLSTVYGQLMLRGPWPTGWALARNKPRKQAEGTAARPRCSPAPDLHNLQAPQPYPSGPIRVPSPGSGADRAAADAATGPARGIKHQHGHLASPQIRQGQAGQQAASASPVPHGGLQRTAAAGRKLCSGQAVAPRRAGERCPCHAIARPSRLGWVFLDTLLQATQTASEVVEDPGHPSPLGNQLQAELGKGLGGPQGFQPLGQLAVAAQHL